MDNIRALVKEDLTRVEDNLSCSNAEENKIILDLNSFLRNGSKRIRSILCLLYLKAQSVNPDEKIIQILSAGELIHNSSLLQDDIIDESEIRREKKAFYKKYNSKIAVLASDYLLSNAVKKLLTVDNSEVLNIFLNATENMSGAELMQYTDRNKKIGKNDYIRIIEGKTASLFEAIMEAAALITNLNREKAKNIGKYFGLLFQINNDLQEESKLNDKKNGINTAFDILGIEKTQILQDNYKEELKKIIKSLPENEYSRGLEGLTELL